LDLELTALERTSALIAAARAPLSWNDGSLRREPICQLVEIAPNPLDRGPRIVA
jgi:hypothetical protein